MMKLALTPGELAFLDGLKREGYLEKVQSQHLPERTVFVTCVDGHQLPDMLMNRCRLHPKTDDKYPCLHTPTVTGGILLLAPRSPLNLPGRSTARDLIETIALGCYLKDTNRIDFEGHFPCWAARVYGIAPSTAVGMFFAAEDRLKKELPQALKTVCKRFELPKKDLGTFCVRVCCQVDWGHAQNSYFFPRKRYPALLERLQSAS